MSLHRLPLIALAALFTAGMTPMASAGCCGLDAQPPVVYAPSGCGNCAAPTAAVVYAQPVAPAPAPVVTTWGTGCGCQRPIVYAAPALEPTPIAPAPIYVVNQGPDYTAPGLVVPYHTWAQPEAYAAPLAPAEYPVGYGYGPTYGYGWRHRHFERAFLPRFAHRERLAYREVVPFRERAPLVREPVRYREREIGRWRRERVAFHQHATVPFRPHAPAQTWWLHPHH